MKFLCLDCDQPMKLHSTEGPDEGSLSVTFRCPECGFRVAMLTNPFETQMVQSLGVKVGGRTVPAEPFENLRATMAGGRPDAFEGTGEAGRARSLPAPAPRAGGAAPAAPAPAPGGGAPRAPGPPPAAPPRAQPQGRPARHRRRPGPRLQAPRGAQRGGPVGGFR